TVQFGYNDGAGNLTDYTDVNGGTWQFAYTSHLLTTTRDPRQAGVPNPPVMTNHYDTSFSPPRVDWQSDQLGGTTSLDYTTIPGATKVTDPKGNVTVDYYTNLQRTKTTVGWGTADAADWQYGYDPDTLGVTTLTDPNNHQWTATYDRWGNRTTATDPL